MVMDPGGPGKTKPPARASAGHDSDRDAGRHLGTDTGLRPIIERLVSSKRFCFEISQHALSATQCDENAHDAAETRKGPVSSGSDGRGQDDIRQPAQGSSSRQTKAEIRRFIGVLDTVYARILSDGEFDFAGFMRARGLGPSDMVDVLEAAAVRLGEEWRCDTKGFVRVTVGISRLQRILTQIAQENRCYAGNVHDRSALVVVPQGETHLFAASLLEERFHLARWETRTLFGVDTATLASVLKNSDFSVICLVWLDETLKDRVEALLAAIRRVDAVHDVPVLAGGFAALQHAGWLLERGVKRVCSDAALAIEMADSQCENNGEGRTAGNADGSDREPVHSA